MIGRLTGVIAAKEPPVLLLDVNGVGYELEAPLSTFCDLPAKGERVTLHTHLVVREDAHLLFGFLREPDRRLFRSLLKVNGIGPRVALAILSGLNHADLLAALVNEDVARLTRVPGVGRKTAERLVVELRDKAEILGASDADRPAGRAADPESEAVNALVALGYRPPEAARAVEGVREAGLASEELIRRALKSMLTATAR
jgi:Holliday junction DNA helicase RuvA